MKFTLLITDTCEQQISTRESFIENINKHFISIICTNLYI